MRFSILIFSFLSILIASGAHAGASSCAQAHRQVSEQSQMIGELEKKSRKPKNATENSRGQLLDTILGILEKYPVKTADLQGELARFDGKTILVDKKVQDIFFYQKKYPAHAILALGAVVEAAGKNIGLTPAGRQTLAKKTIGILLEDLGIPLAAFEAHLTRGFKHSVSLEVSSAEFIKASEDVFALVELDTRFQIPYLAGYSKSNPKRIYIDQNIERIQYFENPNGTSTAIDVYRTLTLHEAVEKSLIDLLDFDVRSYLRTHQVAQRLEKALVEARSVSWEKYQKFAMAREIERAEVQAMIRVPKDLDETPYRDYNDIDLLAKMRSLAVAPVQRHPTENNFQVVDIMPGIVWLKFSDKEVLAETMLRFQEFYESPKFADTVFTLEQFKRWYTKQREDGVFDYYKEWDGFNFPSSVLNSFYSGNFKNLSPEEMGVLNALRFRMHTKQYVIATAGNSGVDTLKHEIAHGFYSLNSQYKAEADQILASLPKELDQRLEDYLMEEVGQYHQKVIRDEKHAWLMHDSTYMSEHNFDIKPYLPYIEQLKSLFERYVPESDLNVEP